MDFTKFKGRMPKPDGNYELYSVLVPLIEIDGKDHLIFELRSRRLRRQPGEICFPGGRVEKREGPMETSVRETMEELNISRENIEIICPLDYIVTPFDFIIYPFLGRIKGVKFEDIDYSTDEVEKIFTVPVDFLINTPPLIHYVEMKVSTNEDYPHHLVEGGVNYRWKTGKYPVYFYHYDGYIIWGLTGRMTAHFTELAKLL